MNAIDKQSLPFYLTGGTALSRGYLRHRYSDDLDFFVNANTSFSLFANRAIEAIRECGFSIEENLMIISPDFVRVVVYSTDGIKLKVDFVNDIPYRNGEPNICSAFPGKIDSIENILTNKLSALIGRSEIKDVVDIRGICQKMPFLWSTMIEEATYKEAIMDSGLIACMLNNIKEKDFDSIAWINKPRWESFKSDIEKISKDILNSSANSLYIE